MKIQAHQFKDTADNLWTLAINIGLYMDIKSETGIDISEIFEQENNWLAQLAHRDNAMQLISILTLCTNKEREKRGLSVDDFYGNVDGDVIEAAAKAFLEAAVLFLPAHKRQAMKVVIQGVYQGLTKAGETIATEADQQMETMLEEMDQAVEESLKNPEQS